MPSPSTQCRATGPLTVDWYKLTGKGKKIDVIRRSIRKTVPFNLLDLCTNCWILMGYWRPPNQGKNAYWRWPLSRRLQRQCKRQTLNYAHTVLSPWENLVSLLFWDVTRRRLVVTYRRFGTVYQSHLQGPSSPRTWLNFMPNVLFGRFQAPVLLCFIKRRCCEHRVVSRLVTERWIGRHIQWISYGIIGGSVPSFAYRVWEKNMKITLDVRYSSGDLDSGPHDLKTEMLLLPNPESCRNWLIIIHNFFSSVWMWTHQNNI